MPAATPEDAAPLEDPADARAVAPMDPGRSQAATQPEVAAPDEPPVAALATETPEPAAPADPNGPQRRTAFYRADANQPPAIPPVVLSKGHAALCRMKVGDTMPEIELDQLGGGRRNLADLLGKRATVVVFWRSDRHMARQQLADMGPDVVEPYDESGVAVVGIAVSQPAAQVQRFLQQADADFPHLLDANGDAFAKVGSEKLPRTYLVDPQGKILWFDIEYSLATRRELHQALQAVTEAQ